jgi:DHA3 family macrolide efflux protein-like MFS transporter
VSGSPTSPRVAGFLAAEAVSAIGSWATIVAIWGYAAYEYDATPAEVSLFGIAFSVPGVVLGPLAGAVVDRIGPKATLAVAKVIGIVASLALLGADDFRTLAALSALHGVASTFSHPALQSMPPRLVDQGHLARTNALVSLTDELAIVLGPVAAGIGIAAFGFRGAFVFDAATYALGLAVLPIVRLRAVRGTSPGGAVESARLRDALEGWRLIVHTGVLRRIVTCTFAVHLLYGTALLAEPLYVRDVLERSPSVFAALQTAFGVCLVVGGLLAARLGDRLASFGWVALGVGASGLTAIVYLGTPFVAVAFVGVGLWGVATAIIAGPSRTLLQRSSPEATHGRVMAADLVAGSAAELIGVAAAGVLVGAFGVPWSITALGLLVAATALVLQAANERDKRVGDEGEQVSGLAVAGGVGGGGSAGAPHPRRTGSAES